MTGPAGPAAAGDGQIPGQLDLTDLLDDQPLDDQPLDDQPLDDQPGHGNPDGLQTSEAAR